MENLSLHILNSPCSREEYNETVQKILKNAKFRDQFLEKLRDLIQKSEIKKSILTGSQNCSGDFCYESKNTLEGYYCGKIEDSAYIYESQFVQDSMDINQWGQQLILSYENVAIGDHSSHMYWCTGSWEGSYHFYTFNCQGGSHLFGCSGLKHASYCIFNKQYAKEEWEKTVKKIIHQMIQEGTWGEYLDATYAIYAYNESHAMEKMPLTRNEVMQRELRWSDREDVPPEGITKIIPGERLPESIEAVPDDILNWAIRCPETKKLFQIQPLELEMHRKFGIPLPRLHPLTRIQRRYRWDKREFSFDF